MMTKSAPVSDFIIVCTPTQMIINGLLDQSMLIQLLWRRWGWSYACPFKIKKGKWPTRQF